MSNNIFLPKHSSQSGAFPDPAYLQVGELALNTADMYLFSKNINNQIVHLNPSVNYTTFATTGSNTFVGTQTVSGTLVLQQTIEKNTISATAANGTINYDTLTQAVLYYTLDATGNWTLNFRGNASTTLDSVMASGQSMTVVFMVTNGAAVYYPTAHQIDSVSVIPKWQGGSAPTTGNANSVDVYSYVIVKTAAATFTVFASQTKFA